MKFRKALFWDADLNKIDTHKNAQYIIERIFDFGNDEEVNWAYHFYDKALLKKIVANSRSLRADTKNLWESILKNK